MVMLKIMYRIKQSKYIVDWIRFIFFLITVFKRLDQNFPTSTYPDPENWLQMTYLLFT